MPRDLAQMSQAEISKLSQRELMRFNNPLPEYDYDAPYNPEDHKYPRHLFGPNDEGTELVSVVVQNEEEHMALEGDWRDSPLDWGIVTHPEAKRYAPGPGFSIPLPKEEVDKLAQRKAEIRTQVIAEHAAKNASAPEK